MSDAFQLPPVQGTPLPPAQTFALPPAAPVTASPATSAVTTPAAPVTASPATITLPQQGPMTATVVGGSPSVVAFGQKVESVFVPAFKGTKGYTKRFAVINPSRVFVAQIHFHDTLKGFHCFNGACCRADNPRQYYLVPGLAYDTNKDGDVASPKISIEYLKCSPGQWDLLTMIHRSQPIDQIDLAILCEDDQYQKLKIAPAGPAMWRQNPQWAQMIVNEFNNKADRILRSMARYLGKYPENPNDAAAMAVYKKECEAALSRANNEVAAVTSSQPAAPSFDLQSFLSGSKG